MYYPHTEDMGVWCQLGRADEIKDVWSSWRSELNLLSEKAIPRCYYPPNKHITHCELHGFCDASEKAYSGVIYLCMTDSEGKHDSSIVVAKTKVAPIRKLTIPSWSYAEQHW